MRPPSRFLALALPALLLAACRDPEPPAAVPEGSACPLTAPVRLASAPGDFEPEAILYNLHVVGDHVLFSFDRADAGDRTYWHTTRCGGPVEEYTSLPPGLVLRNAITTPTGPVLYGLDADGKVHVVDDLSTPAFDEPRELAGLPPIGPTDPSFFISSRSYVTFTVTFSSGPDAGSDAAGIGGVRSELFTHAGDPDVPARSLGTDLVNVRGFDDHLYVHGDDGTVRRVDPRTGAGETVLTGARYISISPDGTKMIWQELGDDQSEPVYLRDLATGVDLGIADNDFAAIAWGRIPDGGELDPGLGRDAGRWRWTGDSAFAAMLGPDGTYVAAVRTDTGEAAPLPPHTRARWPMTRHFSLALGQPEGEFIEAIWDPATGDLFEWHRGPSLPSLKLWDASRAEYVLVDPGSLDQGPLVRVDLTTGETTEVLPRFSRAGVYLRDDLYLNAAARRSVLAPSLGELDFYTYSLDLAFADAATDTYYPIADDITAVTWLPDAQTLLYLDAHGPDPGLWAVPFPSQ